MGMLDVKIWTNVRFEGRDYGLSIARECCI